MREAPAGTLAVTVAFVEETMYYTPRGYVE